MWSSWAIATSQSLRRQCRHVPGQTGARAKILTNAFPTRLGAACATSTVPLATHAPAPLPKERSVVPCGRKWMLRLAGLTAAVVWPIPVVQHLCASRDETLRRKVPLTGLKPPLKVTLRSLHASPPKSKPPLKVTLSSEVQLVKFVVFSVPRVEFVVGHLSIPCWWLCQPGWRGA